MHTCTQNHTTHNAHILQSTGRRLKALWLDGWDVDSPFIGACCGSPALIMRKAGLINIADDLGSDRNASWANMGWSVSVGGQDECFWKVFSCNQVKSLATFAAYEHRSVLVVYFAYSIWARNYIAYSIWAQNHIAYEHKSVLCVFISHLAFYFAGDCKDRA